MPDLRLVFTGSSLLHIHQAKADLSRRVVVYNVPRLSFREFLQFETKTELNTYTIEQIISNHLAIGIVIIQKVIHMHYFSDFLHHAYYPFYLENKNHFSKN